VTNRWAQPGIMYARTVFDPLMAVAADGTVKPYLAQSCTPNPDYTEWTIKLRPNVFFHDGEPLDGPTVAHNLDVFVHGLNGSGLSNVDTVTARDASTVVVTTKEPWVPFPLYLTGQIGYMASPKMLADPNGSMHPIGTGPFMFKEWVPNGHFTAVRNPHYWRAGLPYLDEIEYRPIVDDTARQGSLESGELDVIQTSNTQSIQSLRQNTSFSYVDDSQSTIGEPDVNLILLNTGRPPLDDLRVRQALAYATDVERLVQTVYNGVGQPVNGPFVPGSPYYSDTGYPRFDLAKARELVASYERDKGPISFTLESSTSPQGVQQNLLLQGMWQKAGIHVQVSQSENTTLINNVLVGKFQATGWTQYAAPDPDANYIFWSSRYVFPPGQISINFSRNRDPQIDAALETGRRSSNPAVRVQAYRTVAHRLAVDLPQVWINRTVWATVAKPSVQNFAGPKLPDGSAALALSDGDIWVTQIWAAR
ncbi:MAG TPA: ABC transporter substrate-binding protein, partial [Acidimicrobiales bacterium]|nr:ABC transporter substrate-binding protein [Acidimicrobiales bacterium]